VTPNRLMGHLRRSARPPVKESDLLQHELDGEVLLYDADRQVTHRLNDTAYYIWRHCDGTLDLPAIAARLAQTYDVDPARAEQDVAEALRQMRKNKIIR
jgi:hypothetical protein